MKKCETSVQMHDTDAWYSACSVAQSPRLWSRVNVADAVLKVERAQKVEIPMIRLTKTLCPNSHCPCPKPRIRMSSQSRCWLQDRGPQFLLVQ